MKIKGIKKGSPIYWAIGIIGASLVVAFIIFMMSALIILA